MFDEIPISTIKLPEGRFQTFHDISLSEELKAETCSAIHNLRKLFVFEFWFPSRIVSANLYVAMTSRQKERVINKNYGYLLRNLIVGINGYELLTSRKIMFSI